MLRLLLPRSWHTRGISIVFVLLLNGCASCGNSCYSHASNIVQFIIDIQPMEIKTDCEFDEKSKIPCFKKEQAGLQNARGRK